MRDKVKKGENYLERVPQRADNKWSVDSQGIVTLEVENSGWANRIAQRLFKRPKISYIHLDKNGSFVWQQIDGKRDITSIGEAVKAEFGADAEPLYERLAQFFKITASYGFVKWNNGK